MIDFENRDGIFPAVHRSYKFCVLTIGHDVALAAFAFFLNETTQVTDKERRFTLSSAEIEQINPNSKTTPIFRSRYDAELTTRIYSRVPVLIDGRSENQSNPWQLKFRQGLFNTTSDSGLFGTADRFEEASNAEQSGNMWIVYESLVEGDDTPGWYRPLYEAKMIHQFDHRWATYAGLDSHDTSLVENKIPTMK